MFRPFAAIVMLALLAGCAGDDGEGTTLEVTSAPTAAPTPTSAVTAAAGVDASATSVVRPSGTPARVEEDGPRTQFRDLTLAGTITVATEDGELSGEITFAEEEDITFGPAGPEIVHVWGTATAALDGTSCEGPFAMSAFPPTAQGQGALVLRCDDGSVLSGDLRDTPEIGPDGLLAQLTRATTGSWAAAGVDASATSVVRPSGTPARVEEDGPRTQFRDLTLAGTITVATEDGELSGEITFAEEEDITFGPAGPEIVHVWGTATAALDGSSCEGPFAMSAFPPTAQGQGALVLRCDDGSVLSGDLRDTPEIGPDGLLAQLTRATTGSWAAP